MPTTRGQKRLAAGPAAGERATAKPKTRPKAPAGGDVQEEAPAGPAPAGPKLPPGPGGDIAKKCNLSDSMDVTTAYNGADGPRCSIVSWNARCRNCNGDTDGCATCADKPPPPMKYVIGDTHRDYYPNKVASYHIDGAGTGDAEGAWRVGGDVVIMTSAVPDAYGGPAHQVDTFRRIGTHWVASTGPSKLLYYKKLLGVAVDNTGRIAMLIESNTSVGVLITAARDNNVISNIFVERWIGCKTGLYTISARGGELVVSNRAGVVARL
jgi:hypothetical protein